MFNFAPQATLPSQYILGRRLGGSKTHSLHGREEKNVCPYWELCPDCPVHAQTLY